jgi:hypothetical protein
MWEEDKHYYINGWDDILFVQLFDSTAKTEERIAEIEIPFKDFSASDVARIANYTMTRIPSLAKQPGTTTLQVRVRIEGLTTSIEPIVKPKPKEKPKPEPKESPKEKPKPAPQTKPVSASESVSQTPSSAVSQSPSSAPAEGPSSAPAAPADAAAAAANETARSVLRSHIAPLVGIADHFVTAQFHASALELELQRVVDDVRRLLPFDAARNDAVLGQLLLDFQVRVINRILADPAQFTLLNGITWHSFLSALEADRRIALPLLSQFAVVLDMATAICDLPELTHEICALIPVPIVARSQISTPTICFRRRSSRRHSSRHAR